MTQLLTLTQVKTYTWTGKIKFCYIWSYSCYMSVTVALTVRIAQHWLKLLPALMSFVQPAYPEDEQVMSFVQPVNLVTTVYQHRSGLYHIFMFCAIFVLLILRHI
jgi:hypothetical protein